MTVRITILNFFFTIRLFNLYARGARNVCGRPCEKYFLLWSSIEQIIICVYGVWWLWRVQSLTLTYMQTVIVRDQHCDNLTSMNKWRMTYNIAELSLCILFSPYLSFFSRSLCPVSSPRRDAVTMMAPWTKFYKRCCKQPYWVFLTGINQTQQDTTHDLFPARRPRGDFGGTKRRRSTSLGQLLLVNACSFTRYCSRLSDHRNCYICYCNLWINQLSKSQLYSNL